MPALDKCAGIAKLHVSLSTLKQLKWNFLHPWKTRKTNTDQQTKAHGPRQQKTQKSGRTARPWKTDIMTKKWQHEGNGQQTRQQPSKTYDKDARDDPARKTEGPRTLLRNFTCFCSMLYNEGKWSIYRDHACIANYKWHWNLDSGLGLNIRSSQQLCAKKCFKMVVWYSDYGRDCDGTHGGSNMFHQPATWLTSFSMFWEAYEQAETLNRKN